MSIYLLFAIGFKGGASVADHGIDATLILSLVAGPDPVLRAAADRLRAVAGDDRPRRHRRGGGRGALRLHLHRHLRRRDLGHRVRGLSSEGYMVAVAAVMEAPAILSALWIIARYENPVPDGGGLMSGIMLNGPILLLVGSVPDRLDHRGRRDGDDRALHRGRRSKACCACSCSTWGCRGPWPARGRARCWRRACWLFGVMGPPVRRQPRACPGTFAGPLRPGARCLFMDACGASASYIAVPASCVWPAQGEPAIYLTLSLGVTFPFNLTLGIPFYLAGASALTGG